MDYALLNLAVTLALLLATLAFRKRLLDALGKMLIAGAVAWVQGSLFVRTIKDTGEGPPVEIWALSGHGRAIVAAVTPALVAELIKSIKLKPGATPTLPAGLDLANLSEALPALLGSGLLPKKYAGLIALAAPFLQGFLGGGGPGVPGKASKGTPLEELDTGV